MVFGHSEGAILTSWWRRASLMLVTVSVVGLTGCSSGGGTPAESMEDNFAVLERAADDGDAAAAAKGATAISSAVPAYLTKYPG